MEYKIKFCFVFVFYRKKGIKTESLKYFFLLISGATGFTVASCLLVALCVHNFMCYGKATLQQNHSFHDILVLCVMSSTSCVFF